MRVHVTRALNFASQLVEGRAQVIMSRSGPPVVFYFFVDARKCLSRGLNRLDLIYFEF